MALDPNLAKIIADAIQPHLDEINKSNNNFRQTAAQHNDNLKDIVGQIYSAINYNNSNVNDLISSIGNTSEQSQRIVMEMQSVYQAVNNNTSSLFNLLNEIKDFNNVNRQVLSRQTGFFNNLSQNLSQFSKRTLVSFGKLGKFVTGGAAVGTGAIQTGGALAALGGIGAGAAVAGMASAEFQAMRAQASESAAGLRQGAEISEGVPGPGGGAPSGKPSESTDGKPTLSQGLGSLSAKYESGGRGVGFISSGSGDPGGQSYGVHQLSSAYSMGAFLRSPEGKPYADQFRGLTPGSPQFNEVYRRIAKQSPKEFEQAQKSFYVRTHYNPLLEHAKKLGYDVNNRGIQEALFSMSIQHGKAKLIVSRAAKNGIGKNAEEQLRGLYRSRREYVSGLSTMPERTRQSVLRRYDREEIDALNYSKQKEENKDEKQGAPDAKPSSPSTQQTPNATPTSGDMDQLPDATRNLRVKDDRGRTTTLGEMGVTSFSQLSAGKGYGGQAFRGGRFGRYNDPNVTFMAGEIQGILGNKFNRVTAQNDAFHHGSYANRYRSQHLQGTKLDFTIKGDRREYQKQVNILTKQLKEKYGLIEGEHYRINRNFNHGTGMHVDIGFTPSGRKLIESYRQNQLQQQRERQQQKPAEGDMPKPPGEVKPESKPESKPKPVTEPSTPRGMLEGLNPKDAEQQLRGAEEKPREGEILNQAATQRDIERMTQQQTTPTPQQQEQPTQPQMGPTQQSPSNVATAANWTPRTGSQDYADISAYYRQKNVHTNRESVQSMYT